MPIRIQGVSGITGTYVRAISVNTYLITYVCTVCTFICTMKNTHTLSLPFCILFSKTEHTFQTL